MVGIFICYNEVTQMSFFALSFFYFNFSRLSRAYFNQNWSEAIKSSESMNSFILEVSDKEFDDLIGKCKVPVLIEFWKPGCGHCQSLLKEQELLQDEIPRQVKILKMHVEENHTIPGDLEILSLPALALYLNGEFQQFIGGLGKKNELMEKLAPWLPASPSS